MRKTQRHLELSTTDTNVWKKAKGSWPRKGQRDHRCQFLHGAFTHESLLLVIITQIELTPRFGATSEKNVLLGLAPRGLTGDMRPLSAA